jgi:hypothetical protein
MGDRNARRAERVAVDRGVEPGQPHDHVGVEGADPDVMLVSPTIWPKDPVEADYLHAGRALGIPTIGYVNSWDNLTSKGTVHVLPDVYIVWNEPSHKRPSRFTTSRRARFGSRVRRISTCSSRCGPA